MLSFLFSKKQMAPLSDWLIHKDMPYNTKKYNDIIKRNTNEYLKNREQFQNKMILTSHYENSDKHFLTLLVTVSIFSFIAGYQFRR